MVAAILDFAKKSIVVTWSKQNQNNINDSNADRALGKKEHAYALYR